MKFIDTHLAIDYFDKDGWAIFLLEYDRGYSINILKNNGQNKRTIYLNKRDGIDLHDSSEVFYNECNKIREEYYADFE